MNISACDPAPGAAHTLDVRFTGSGSEYFRIWIVNLLLTLVTIGLYYPWAKVRKLRYFHGNTLVGGHALDFHGEPKKMLRGYLLVGALVGLYSTAGQFSPVAGLVALVLVALIWPALLRASMQFRLANTSWRGLRFRFLGSMGGAYRALLPLFVPAIGLLAVSAFAVMEDEEPGAGFALAMGIVTLGTVLLVPLLWWMLKKYQHDHYAIGQIHTRLEAGVGAFYGVFLKTIGVTMLVGALFAVVVGLAAWGFTAPGSDGDAADPKHVLLGALMAGSAYLLMFVTIGPYVTCRLQNLVWGRTRSDELRFHSQMRVMPFIGLSLKNLLLMIVTLGFYWPFAKVAVARMRLEAVSLATRLHPDTLLAGAQPLPGDAAGDFAGDLFGIDIGL